jgi:photosystem II stability/assembly factor-like uncharacterized protein
MNKLNYSPLIILATMLLFTNNSIGQGDENTLKTPDILSRTAIVSHKASYSVLLTVANTGNRLFAAGERGIILSSEDGGLKWKQATVPTSINLTSLEFTDEKNGWVTGHMGVILNTKDGGKTWTKQLDGIQAAQIAVKSVADSDNKIAIKEANFLVSDGPDKPFFDIDMRANGHGIAVGAFNLAFETHDFGKNWHYLSPNIDNKLNRHLYQVSQVKEGYVILGEQGLILYSSDDGKSFQTLSSPYEGSWFGFLATSDDAWIAYGLKGNLYASYDHGQSWSKINSKTQATISAATELNDGTVILATQAGELLAGKSISDSFTVVKHLHGFPVTAIDEAKSGDLIVAGLRGVINVNKKDIKK